MKENHQLKVYLRPLNCHAPPPTYGALRDRLFYVALKIDVHKSRLNVKFVKKGGYGNKFRRKIVSPVTFNGLNNQTNFVLN